VLSGRGLCDELIICPGETYRLCCIVVYDLETSRIGAPYFYDICSLRVKVCFYNTEFTTPGTFVDTFKQDVENVFKFLLQYTSCRLGFELGTDLM
jgi:hypothetical protein